MKVLIAKPGLDGHDRGAKVVARAFKDAGAEVIYTGLQATPDEIADIAEKEHVDVVGVSLLSGAHNTLMPKVIDKVKAKEGMDKTVFILGGIIPQQDIPALMEKGVSGVFGPGTPLDEVVDFTFEQVAMAKAEELAENAAQDMTNKASNI
ncbi:cobalamin B12-binding domain-containing protein [Cloacibacillus sp. An23]|uniref:cobalamin B12-binding domain-containing protein n=1 Tax=Cloacibacillus sp. An23 TaxID=1965591 RepID=UPI000B38B1C4|nr:cobalamin B12-binding domain-containing protein [Cloacibacillus sp. An23]OUO95005.1 methylmalonyl-CoA mutase [Cloacibacillus sp. An23]